MSHNLPKVMERVKAGAERALELDVSANEVLHQAINQYAFPLIRYKQAGIPPDMGGLEDLAGKLIAIAAATYDARDARRGSLP